MTTGTGSNYYITGDDVVYAFTPTFTGTINITTTNDDDWVGLWAFTGCPFASTVGYHTSISGATRAINALPVQQGETYYIVISSWPTPQSIDYTLHVEMEWVAEPCTDTPDPGATTGPASVCPNVAFTLSVENPSTNTGITYQWETSAEGMSWANAPGNSTGSTYAATQAVDTWYRCQMSCDAAGTGTSTPLHVTINPPLSCYCIPTGSANNADEILNFTLAGLSHSSSPSEGIAGYSDYTATVPPAQLEAGTAYTATLTSGTGSGNHGAAIWIDYNGNGLFDTDELVASIALSIQPNTTASFPAFTAADAPGVHRLRVQYTYNQAGAGLNPCAITTQFAETEDYLVEISAAGVPDCLGVVGGPALPGTPCISPNGYGGVWSADCICVENVGIEEQAAPSGLALHPNPASTEVWVDTGEAGPMHVKVYDIRGRLVIEQEGAPRLDIRQLAPGSYTLHLLDGQGAVKARGRFQKH